jgi:hypothetical protein
MIFPDGSHYTG